MKNKISQFVSLANVILLTSGALAAETLLYEFTFNDNSQNELTQSSGDESLTLNFTSFVNANSDERIATDLYGARGSGVSGKSDDLAYDNTNSPSLGCMAQARDASNPVNDLKFFTLSGWFKSTGPGSYSRIIEIGKTALFFSEMEGASTQRIEFSTRINDMSSDPERVSTNLDHGIKGEWVFFAVTYDGSSGEANIYVGSETLRVESMAVAIFAKGKVVSGEGQRFSIGNSSYHDNQRPFEGYLDNIRVWGSSDDSSAALNMKEVQSVMANDLKNRTLR
ncbi:LamG domain-containing protein [Cerasicoccus arenae]|uniref:LamG domain-containing protein n=1 Tax=Cerasicoccus arenae TaxID=424488 RepID=A0A8J3GC15_9BACT|nr:LamG domain-containing protein [Cerasicoccus arenae]MBK1857727.1 LamG domain-containing protein [Cerasicoccus arenae]GHB91150.1 hypothetical protein GCM10007047_02630 [Cerasicoccus arenae]